MLDVRRVVVGTKQLAAVAAVVAVVVAVAAVQ